MLMTPGVALFYGGMVRRKNLLSTLMMSFVCLGLVGILWIFFGYSLAFGADKGGFIGGLDFIGLRNVGQDPSSTYATTIPHLAFMVFQGMFAIITVALITGAVVERIKFSTLPVFSALWMTLVYSPVTHWVWGSGGWLAEMGVLDFAGGAVVHITAGISAMALVLILGKRRGFPHDAMEANNIPMVVIGAGLLWFGWFGFNGGSTLSLNGSVPGIIAKTTLAASTGSAACLFYTWYRTGLPKVTALINGSLGGLVSITANCHCVSSLDAAIIGIVSGLVCVYCEQWLLRFKVDDAVGAVPVHLGCGIWGTLAVALFGDATQLGTGLGFWAQFGVQIEGVVAAFLVAFVIPYFVIRRIDRIRPMRVSREEEEKGLNVSEHGAATELHDLFEAMDYQTQTGDLSVRVPVEPFTEVGQIARKYNQLMHALELASSKIEAVFRSASDAIVTFATDTHRILHVNPSAWRMFGFAGPAAMVGCPVSDLFGEREADGRKAVAAKLLSHTHVEFSGLRQDGRRFPVEGIVTVSGTGGDSFYVGTFRDISGRKAAAAKIERQQAFFRELFDSSPLGIMMVGARGLIVDVNERFSAMFEYAPEELRGGRDAALLVPEHLIEEAKAYLGSVLKGNTIIRETIRKSKTGRLLDVALFIYPIQVNDEIQGAYYIYSDITQRKEFETQLAHQAFHDALTGLPNRVLFFERLATAVQRKKRKKRFNFAAMMLDMDRFKAINDTLGHHIGDAFLVAVADRIRACIRNTDTVARLGGDEFGIIIEDFNHLREVVDVATRIIQVLEKPLVIENNEIRTSASVGIVLRTGGYTDAEAMMRDADIAMYRAKAIGKGCFKVFNDKMHTQVVRESELERELRAAISNGELTVYYQPIVSVRDTALLGFEALVRWNHPVKGLVSPVEFIPVAEETGQILAIGEFVMKEACRQMAQWQKLMPDKSHLTVSVNVSARQFQSVKMPKFVEAVLQETGLAPQCLKLEITESTLMKDARTSINTMQALKNMGVRIVVDDFGTGYSSLSYIQRFPIDGLKIDRSFISGGSQTENPKIVQTIVALAKSIGVDVVAEGVEEQKQLEMLKTVECEYAQGFMFSRPIDGDEATRRFLIEN